MRSLPLLLLGILTAIVVTGQQQTSKIIRCYTFESMQDFRAKHPNAETDAQFETWLEQKKQERQLFNQRPHIAYTIPIIFHIVHDGEAPGVGSNLSAVKIDSQLAQLNRDYANLSGSAWAQAANTEIQFCLARQRPDGTILPEPGIDRIDRNTMSWIAPPYNGLASNSYVDVTIMPNSIWDPYRYFNVWTLDLASTLLGKSTFPASSTLSGLNDLETDTHAGVFVEHESVGSKFNPGPGGTAFGMGRTLSHEAGHFFGLRHIWGDGDCTATDFCADTPPQDQETSGCPATGTLNGCTPSVPKMFENYMDYTDDDCVNTITADQTTRIQTVMANSPRRVTLGISDGCILPATNSIRFVTTATATTETGVGACPRTKDIVLTLRVSSSANGNATVTFTKSGTSTDNIDYTVIPTSVSYTNGDAADKIVTIRINDDAAIEGAETIIIGFTITGGSGVVNGTSGLTHTITVIDDDIIPVVNNAGTVVLLNEDFGTSGGTLPVGWVGAVLQGGNQWAVSTNGGAGITGQCAHITRDNGAKPLEYDALDPSGALLITPLINSSGFTNATLSFTYKCQGEADVNGVYDFGILTASTDGVNFSPVLDQFGNPYIFQGVSAATTANIPLPSALISTNFYLGFVWINDDNTGTDPPLLVDDVVVSTQTTQVESQTTNSGTENIFSGQDVFMLTDDDQIVARIQNPNADIGCLTAALTQAGTGTTGVTTTGGSYLRTNKVIQITPAVPNSAVTYQGTLYFSTAELAVWAADIPNLKILKVTDGTNLAGTLNSSNSEIITPLFTDNSANGYYSYRGDFTGFSQFMLVSPSAALPVELLSFEAKAVRRSIVLNWSTSQEINNKGFAIERSIDAANYIKIGWVDGMINSNTRTDYTYTDYFVQPGITYYYRLRQTDIDDREKLSPVRQAKITESGALLTINPNPAKDEVNIFISGTTAPARVTLVNMQGQTIRRWAKVNTPGAPLPLNISGLASGLYLLEVQLPGEKLVEKLVIR